MLAPGSRSTPLALALVSHTGISTQIFHDERNAGFAALGVGVTTGVPAVVLCSSGTAAAHFYASVIEADASCIPMIVCTADRPPHLRDVAAPQTIDQTKLFGDAVRWFHDPGVPTAIPSSTWRALAARIVDETRRHSPGPVHVNLPFDEPLFGVPGDLPAPRSQRWSSTHLGSELSSTAVTELAQMFSQRRGVFIAGRRTPIEILRCAENLGWPIFADPRSGVRVSHDNVIAGFDALLRIPEMTRRYEPDIVVSIGEAPASKVLSQWLSSLECDIVQVHDDDKVKDPLHKVSHAYMCDTSHLFSRLCDENMSNVNGEWLTSWKNSDEIAQDVISKWTSHHWSEISVSRVLSQSMGRGSQLVVSSSMPIRDFEWFGDVLDNVDVFANRGANGIDGVVSTAIGAAVATQKTTYVLIGDVAFLHDSNSLLNLSTRGVDLRIVVTNNDGGSIFSFLPQAQHVENEQFEKIYGTPHGVVLASLCEAHNVRHVDVSSGEELRTALTNEGPIVIECRFDRGINVGLHDEVHRLVTDAVSANLA
ncbi:MAG: 2-succinyl-5-enolpyruvyl-6-hydroxy-3-cyclohexene-carboxylic-acid synthase [Actinomycetota bacterium]